MIEVTSCRMKCTLLTSDYSRMPVVALQNQNSSNCNMQGAINFCCFACHLHHKINYPSYTLYVQTNENKKITSVKCVRLFSSKNVLSTGFTNCCYNCFGLVFSSTWDFIIFRQWLFRRQQQFALGIYFAVIIHVCLYSHICYSYTSDTVV